GKRPDSLPGGLRLEPRSVSQQLAQELTGHIRPMSRAELQGMSGASDELMRTLEAYRLIWADETGRYDDHSLKVARAAVTLTGFGFEARHLRPFRIAADRELGMVEHATSGIAQNNGGVSKEGVTEAAREITLACLRSHAGVVSAEMADMDGSPRFDSGSIKIRTFAMAAIVVKALEIRIVLPCNQPILLLLHQDSQRLLRLRIGPSEGTAIGLAQQGVDTPRPTTHQLLVEALEQAGDPIDAVRIAKVDDEV